MDAQGSGDLADYVDACRGIRILNFAHVGAADASSPGHLLLADAKYLAVINDVQRDAFSKSH